jgi:hypothetical protein
MKDLKKDFEAFLNSIGQRELKKNKKLNKVIMKLDKRIELICKYYSKVA